MALVCGGVIGTVLFLSPSDGAANEVRAGVAREEFILPKGVPLAGFSRRKGKPSSGQHDPVGVRALVVQDADTTVALVSCDLLIVDERLFEAVHRRLTEQGLPHDLTLILAATHTHSGPGAYGKKFFEKVSMGHFDPRVFDAIAESAARAVVRAHAGLVPIHMVCRSGTADHLVTNRVGPHGPVDPELPACAFYPVEERTPMAVIVSFAAHPTTLGAWNQELSADYPGVIVREVERRFPTATCLFFAGAVGDQGPLKSGEGFERPERVGLPLAQQAIALLENADPAPAQDVRVLQERMRLPPAEVRLGRLTFPRWLGAQFVDDDATLSLLTMGNAVFFGAPCDLASALGQELKAAARSRGLEPVIVGFASDYVGYCVPEALYEAKKYESSMAFNGPRAGELIVHRLIEMLARVMTRDT